MTNELKRIHLDAVPAALERARHYRLLNDPHQAESICLDVLAAAPGHAEARVVLLLALTDQFDSRLQDAFPRARELAQGLEDEYERAYYTGLVYERRARSQYRRGGPGVGTATYEWLDRALAEYDRASRLSPGGNDEALLRWNACVRLIESEPRIRPEMADAFRPLLE
jgi:hypothetical protein